MPEATPNAATRKPSIKRDTNVLPGERLKYNTLLDGDRDLTIERAYAHLELERFVGERAVDDSHVQYLYDEWRRGRFIWRQVQHWTAKLGDKVYGINGQHTCWLRVHLPEAEPARIRVVNVEVEDEEQLRRLYGVFDTHKARTPGHMAIALLAGTDITEGVWTSCIPKLVAGLKLYLWEAPGDQQRNGPHEIKALLGDTYGPLFTQVAGAFQRHHAEGMLRRVACVAAMFATYNKLPTKADEFWDMVATGIGFTEKTDPRYKLRELILRVKSGGHMTTKDRIMGTEDLYRHCIMAWNKWRAGEPVVVLNGTTRRIKPA